MAKDTVNHVADSLANSLKYNSQIFERSKEYMEGHDQWIHYFLGLSWHNAIAVVLLVGLFVFLVRFSWYSGRMVIEWRVKSHSLRNSIFFSLVFACFFGGAVIYYYGYDYAGTYKNTLTLLLRSVLSSFEMFLSKSNLIGIADNCKNSHWYMLAFAIVHTLAVVLSAIFAVACFGKRIMY